MDEQQAIVRLKQGDLKSLEVLVQLYQARAVHAAVLILGARDQAEDIVQNAFIRAAERIRQYDIQRPFGPWFLRIVVNESLKEVNRQNRWASLDEDDSGPEVVLYDPTPLPEELLETQETRREVWLALQQLPPNQRAAIVLRYYLEMPEKDIAEQLQGPAATIRWWLHAARQRLANLLAPKMDASEDRNLSKTPVHKSGEQQ